MRTALSTRRRVVASVPLAVLVVGTALAAAAGVDGSPALVALRPPAAAKVTATTAPPAPTTSGGGVLEPTATVGEQGEAVSTCNACTSETLVPQTLQHLGTRTTGGGITIRVYAQPLGSPTQGAPSGSQGQLPAECTPTRVIQAELSDAQAVTQAGGEVFGSAPATMAVLDSGEWGVAEGSPAAFVIVLAPPSASWVEVDFDDGGSDAVAPTDGIAVLAAPLAAQPALPSGGQPQGTLAAFAASGSEVASAALGTAEASLLPAACRSDLPLVPALPNAGPQPRHVVAARAAVTKAFTILYSARPDSIKFAYLQDPSDLVARAGKAAAATAAIAAKTYAVVKKVVFTDATHAAVLYEIDYKGNPVVGPRIGDAVVVGGTWKVTRATFCGVIDDAGRRPTC
ncbi:MAG: hypothetical protein ACLQRH_26380 [Acidimicrobiales bacterium]